MANLTNKIQAEWDEDRGGERSPENNISFPEMGFFYSCTKKALPRVRAKHESGRVVVPSAWLEGLFRKARVEAPHSLSTDTDRFLVKGLGLSEFISDALQLLIDEGLLEDENDDGVGTSN